MVVERSFKILAGVFVRVVLRAVLPRIIERWRRWLTARFPRDDADEDNNGRSTPGDTLEPGDVLDHERYMRRTIEIAKGNPDAPFGCVIADAETGEVVAEGLNDAEKSPILHGETAAIIDLAEKRPDADPSRLVLYTTAEPCPMCSGAILWSGIPSVVLGTRLHTLKRLGHPHIDLSCEEVSDRSSFGGFEVVYGVLEDECDALFEDLARWERQ